MVDAVRVYVTNIPVEAFVSAFVEVPDGTTEEGMNGAIGKAVKENLIKPAMDRDFTLDTRLIDSGWEFDRQ